jgi:hypothetical protein
MEEKYLIPSIDMVNIQMYSKYIAVFFHVSIHQPTVNITINRNNTKTKY